MKLLLLLSLLMLFTGCPGQAPAMDYGSGVKDGPLDVGPLRDQALTRDRPREGLPRTDATDMTPDVPLVPFGDVPAGHPEVDAIQWVRQQGIMIGCQPSPPLFCPDAPLTRAEAAVTLVRMKHGETFTCSPTPHFNDVPATHWAFKHVQKFFEDGGTTGCATGLFCPDDDTNRAQGATFLMRLKHGDSFSFSPTPHFSDVPATHWAFKYVQKLFEDGVTVGCGTGTFCPDTPLPRKYWAVFLYRVKTL